MGQVWPHLAHPFATLAFSRIITDSWKGACTKGAFCFMNDWLCHDISCSNKASFLFKNARTIPLREQTARKAAFILFLWSLLLACNNGRNELVLFACKCSHRHNRDKVCPIKVANKTPRAVFKVFSITCWNHNSVHTWVFLEMGSVAYLAIDC